jgi:hypothetical protein
VQGPGFDIDVCLLDSTLQVEALAHDKDPARIRIATHAASGFGYAGRGSSRRAPSGAISASNNTVVSSTEECSSDDDMAANLSDVHILLLLVLVQACIRLCVSGSEFDWLSDRLVVEVQSMSFMCVLLPVSLFDF